MGRISNIEKDELTHKILRDYANGKNIGDIVRKYADKGYEMNWQNVANFIESEENKQTDAWKKAIEERNINVLREISKIYNKVNTLAAEYEQLRKELPKEDLKGRSWMGREFLEAVKILGKYLEIYTNTMEKIYNLRNQEEFHNAIIDAIKEEHPDVALKVIEKIKGIKERRQLLD